MRKATRRSEISYDSKFFFPHGSRLFHADADDDFWRNNHGKQPQTRRSIGIRRALAGDADRRP
ncbi:hypothetical protein EMIT0P2_10482 [Pseudomonas sp. IT-P2]